MNKDNINEKQIQWFPGHMARARRILDENLKLVDVVIEIVDARIPFSSRNPEIDRILKQKLELYCKNFLSEFEILDISEKYEYDDKGITLTVSIKLRGNIAVQQEIMMNNEN